MSVSVRLLPLAWPRPALSHRKCLSTAGMERKITPHIIQADFYRQNWPFLLLDTQLNVALCQHSVSTVYIIYTWRGGVESVNLNIFCPKI